MPTTFTLVPGPFPVGATVGVYSRRTMIGPTGPIGGTVITTGVVAANLTTVFTGLEFATEYWAAGLDVYGAWRKVAFSTAADPGATLDGRVGTLEGNTVDKTTAVTQAIGSRLTIGAPTGIALNLDGNLDGQGGANPNPYRLGFGIGCVNGSNGSRGDAINSDPANGAGAAFFAPYYQNATFATKGSITAYASYLTVNETAGGGEYGEGFGFYSGVVTNRKGALTGGVEAQNTIASGKPARGCAGSFIVKENNAPPTYTGFARTTENGYLTADFGADSEWLKGARVLDIVSGGSQSVGVGINFRGAFTRPILFEPDASNGFAIGSSGFVDVLRSNATATIIRGFSTAESKQQERFRVRADGQLGVGPGTGAIDALLERSQAGVWKVTNAIQFVLIAAASVPNNTIFLDSADNVLKRKDNTGAVAAI